MYQFQASAAVFLLSQLVKQIDDFASCVDMCGRTDMLFTGVTFDSSVSRSSPLITPYFTVPDKGRYLDISYSFMVPPPAIMKLFYANQLNQLISVGLTSITLWPSMAPASTERDAVR